MNAPAEVWVVVRADGAPMEVCEGETVALELAQDRSGTMFGYTVVRYVRAEGE